MGGRGSLSRDLHGRGADAEGVGGLKHEKFYNVVCFGGK